MQVQAALRGESVGSTGQCQHLAGLLIVCFIEIPLWSLAVCTSVCGVWGDPPTAPTGGDSCHQFTDVCTPVVLYCFHLEGALSSGDSCHYITDVCTSIALYCNHLEGASSGGHSCNYVTEVCTSIVLY